MLSNLRKYLVATPVLFLFCLICLSTRAQSFAPTPLTSVSLAGNPVSPTIVGTAVTLTATPVGGITPEYQFWTRDPGSPSKTLLRGYNTNRNCVWTPALVGTYTLVVYAREHGTTIPYKVYAAISYIVKAPPLTAVALAGDPVSPVVTGTEVTLTATPTGGASPDYQFWVRVPGSVSKTMLRDYSSVSTCSWTPIIIGTYTLLVYAREHGSTIPYKVYATLVYNVKTPPITAVFLEGEPPSPTFTGTEVTLTATATGGVAPDYQFWVRIPGSAAKSLLRGYDSAQTCLWTPAIAGKYTLLVYAREHGSTVPYQAYQTLTYTVNTPPLSAVALAGDPESPVIASTEVLLTATPTGGSAPQYQFLVTKPGSEEPELLQDYSLSSTCQWTPNYGGTYTLRVNVREAGSIEEFQFFDTLAYSVTNNINSTDGAEMVWAPPGTFTMGSAEGIGYSDEQPAHNVTLTGFWIYKDEVTVAQYSAFCLATQRSMPPFPDEGYSWLNKTGWDDLSIQQHPIVNVSWHDAKAYADWAGATLPTEAQWEYAARGLEGRNYPWGGIATTEFPYDGWDVTKCANYYNSYLMGLSTWPVGSFPKGTSWCGAEDMAGNVTELCWDWYGDYPFEPVTDPTGPDSGYARVMRGGPWDYGNEDVCRSTFRDITDSAYWNYDIGFRCVYVPVIIQ